MGTPSSVDRVPVDAPATGLQNDRPGETLSADWAPFRQIAFATELTVVAAVVATLLVTFINTVWRYALNSGLTWAADATTIGLSLIAFPGAAAYYRRSDGMAYVALVERFPGRVGDTLRAVGLWVLIAVCGLSLSVFPSFLISQVNQLLPVLGINHGFVAVWLGVGLLLMAAFAVEKLWLLSGPSILSGLAATGAIAGMIALFYRMYQSGQTDVDPFLVILPVILIAFFAAMPVAFVLAVGGVLYFLITADVPLTVVPSSFQAGIGSFILLAVPFFLLSGSLMEITGMARRLVDVAQYWVGHWTGGLLMAEVVATYLFSGVSGVKAADVATIGGIMKKPMREHGYPATEFVAVLAASAAMAETVPPSVAMLLLGSVTTISVGALFVAGFLPAAILAVALLVAVAIRSRSLGLQKGEPFQWSRALGSIPRAVPALGIPIIVIGGLVGGVASPTESASFAVVYGIAAVVLVSRSLGVKPIWVAFRDAALVSAMVLVMIATANLLVRGIVVDGIGGILAKAFAGFTSPTAFLLISMAALIVIGFVLEGFPAILVTAPILLPIAERIGVDALQFGILLIMAIGIGIMMPPVGLGFYITCAVGEAPVNESMRPSWVYNVFLVLGLVVVILFPEITLWLPRVFHMH
jgi:C4-dicarboxylate transporter, DctM subunit